MNRTSEMQQWSDRFYYLWRKQSGYLINSTNYDAFGRRLTKKLFNVFIHTVLIKIYRYLEINYS